MSARVSPKPNSSSGTSRSAILSGRMRPLRAVMTDKATVEIPSPVEGEIVWLGAEVGDVVAVGSDLVRLKVAGDDNSSAARRATLGEGSSRRNCAALCASKPRCWRCR